jgi:hypothetical protein
MTSLMPVAFFPIPKILFTVSNMGGLYVERSKGSLG